MAVYPRAAGSPDYSGNYIPEIWDPRIQVRFYKKAVTWDICNTMYEGDIKKYGETVNIRTYPDITVNAYSKNMELSTQIPDSSKVQMLIDKGQYTKVYHYGVTHNAKQVNCWKPEMVISSQAA